MLRVTFYSYKGGVGRTLALLNVAAVLAQSGRRVVAVDLDLEAPGFGLSEVTRRKGSERGVSDLLFDRRARGNMPVEECAYPILAEQCGDNLRLMPTGTRVNELSRRLSSFYADPAGDAAGSFQLLVAEIEAAFRPDYVLFDSRTGKADIAGVCTIELPQVVVAVCGLNDQNVFGMKQTLEELAEHPARVEPVATVLVVSPVPRPEDLGVRSAESILDEMIQDRAPSALEREKRHNPLIDRLYRVQTNLLPLVKREFEKVQGYFPRINAKEDIYHALPYDPMVPLTDEFQLTRGSDLSLCYRMLARTLTRMHPKDTVLKVPKPVPAPMLIPLDFQ